MTFKTHGYTVIRRAIPKATAAFNADYLLLRREVARTMQKTKYVPPDLGKLILASEGGSFNDAQVPGAYSLYGDCAMETLLTLLKPKMEKCTRLKLVPTYAYARIYNAGNTLARHTDRFSCEVSTTMFLGGDDWPIYLEAKNKKIKVKFKPGDMLIYKGSDLPHWREAFQGTVCCQVFLHYNTVEHQHNKYDRRPHLGLPHWYKKK